jgi:tetratricopeptide (TPR) repeat protein
MMRYADALANYDKAIALKHDYADAYHNRGATLCELKRYDDALASCHKAIALKPDSAEAYINQGSILDVMQRYDDALASYAKAIALRPDSAEAYHDRGNTLVTKGDMQEAEKAFSKALALRPDYPSALFSLTQIRKYKIADREQVTRIHKLINNSHTSRRDKEYLYFALGKIHDDCGLYDDAFECYRQGNQIRNADFLYNPDRTSEGTSSLIDVFSQEFLAQPRSFASDSQSPLFIVGMPRSGTTLMASILSNHRFIDTAGELPALKVLTSRLPDSIENGIPYPHAVTHLTPGVAERLINQYEKRLRRDTDVNVLHVIDKHPLNFWHLGFITLLFPKALIIHCTRHPLDTCLSNYFQLFVPSYDYSFDLRNIGHFYGEYIRIMKHWRKHLSKRLIEISYEDMVIHTEQVARKVLDSLGLEWDERCLAPHTNPCAVETSSRWQVRQPIYNKSVERWRHYEKHLTPLKEILQLTDVTA